MNNGKCYRLNRLTKRIKNMERPILRRTQSEEEFSIVDPDEICMNGEPLDNGLALNPFAVRSTVNGNSILPLHFPGMTESQQVATFNPLQEQLELQLQLNNGLRDDLYKNNSLLRQQLASLKNFQDQSLKSRDQLKNTIDTLQRERQKLVQENDVLSQDKQQLEQQVTSQNLSFSKTHQELSSIKKKCLNYEDELKRLEVTILTISSQLKEGESEVAQLKLEKENAANQNEALVQQLERQKSAYQDQLSSAQQRHVDFESELAPLKSDMELLRAEALQLKIENEKLANQNEVLIEQLNKQAAHRNQEKSVLEQRCFELEQRHLGTSHFNARIIESQKDVAKLKKHNQQLEQEKSEMLEQLKQLGVKFGLSYNNSVRAEDVGDFSIVNDTSDMVQQVSKALMDKLEQEEHITQELNKLVRQQREQIADYHRKLQEAKTLLKQQESDIAKRFIKHHDPSSSLKSASTFLQNYEERCNSVGQQLGACQERLESLKLEDNSSHLIEGLQKQVGDLQLLLEHEKQEKLYDRHILEERIEQLTKEYRQIIASWEIYEQEQQSKGRQNEALTQIANRQHQEKMDELTAQVMNLEEEKQALVAEVGRFKGQIDLLQRDSEQIPILRAQVEVYQQDFQKERESRLKAESHLETTKQEATALQIQMTQLQDELSNQEQRQWLEIASPPDNQASAPLESLPREPPPPVEVFRIPRSSNVRVLPYEPDSEELDSGHRRRRGHNHHHSSRSRRSLGSTAEEPPLIPMAYECPKCNMAYTSVEAVENHVEGCLQENDGPYP